MSGVWPWSTLHERASLILLSNLGNYQRIHFQNIFAHNLWAVEKKIIPSFLITVNLLIVNSLNAAFNSYQSYHSNSSHYPCLSWVSPVLDWDSVVSWPRTVPPPPPQQQQQRIRCGSSSGPLDYESNAEPRRTPTVDLNIGRKEATVCSDKLLLSKIICYSCQLRYDHFYDDDYYYYYYYYYYRYPSNSGTSRIYRNLLAQYT